MLEITNIVKENITHLHIGHQAGDLLGHKAQVGGNRLREDREHDVKLEVSGHHDGFVMEWKCNLGLMKTDAL